MEEHRTFKSFSDSKILLDEKIFKMIDGEKVKAGLPLGWIKSFSMGVVVLSAKRLCTDCDKDTLCDKCNLIN